MASTVIWFPVGLFRIYCVDLKNQFCYADGSWRHLGSHGIWGHMAVFTSFRKGMPSLTAFSRARWCLDGERFECQQNFHATQNVCRFFLMVLESYRACVFMPGNGLPCCHCGRLGAAAPSY